MHQIEAYETSDGEVFTDKALADEHERRIEDEKEIERFIAQSPNCSKRGQGTRARRVIQEFLEHLQGGNTTNEETVPRE